MALMGTSFVDPSTEDVCRTNTFLAPFPPEPKSRFSTPPALCNNDAGMAMALPVLPAPANLIVVAPEVAILTPFVGDDADDITRTRLPEGRRFKIVGAPSPFRPRSDVAPPMPETADEEEEEEDAETTRTLTGDVEVGVDETMDANEDGRNRIATSSSIDPSSGILIFVAAGSSSEESSSAAEPEPS